MAVLPRIPAIVVTLLLVAAAASCRERRDQETDVASLSAGHGSGDLYRQDSGLELGIPRRVDPGVELPRLYPATFGGKPAFPSPCRTDDGTELVTAMTHDGKYTLVPVTVENGSTLDHARRLLGKGRQLGVDGEDFPALLRTGLHEEDELDRTRTIVGRSVVKLTELGRPQQLSWTGFLAADEDLLSVLKGDNRLVARLGLTHVHLARPLFHIWNVALEERKHGRRGTIGSIVYHDKRLSLSWIGSKGWQKSLFDDEISGQHQFEVSRALDARERSFLRTKYGHLDAEQMEALVESLSRIHSGEMVPYYVMRYGFYEGHTDYRADPIAIAWIFGLRSLEEIEAAFGGELDRALTRHFTRRVDDR